MDDATSSSGLAGRPGATHAARRPTWTRLLAAVVVVAAFVAVYTRYHDADRVLDTPVLATCPAAAGAPADPVTADLDTRACTSPPVVRGSARGDGWSVVAFALPASLGLDPVTGGVYSDTDARTVTLDHEVPVDESHRDAGAAATVTLVFVEVPTDKLPPVPFTVEGAEGPVTVTQVPAAG